MPPAPTSLIRIIIVLSFITTWVIFDLTAYGCDGNALIAVSSASVQASLVGYTG